MGMEHKVVQANGLKFAYLEEGEGPLVLLVHGFPDTAHTWDAVRPAVARAGFRAVAPFQRGYAPTEIPPRGPFDAETLGRDLLALIAALGEERAVIVGHDFGASAAFSAAGVAPERLRLLVTMAIPHPASMRPSPSLLWNVRHFLTLSLPGAAGRIRRGNFAHIDELWRRWSPGWDVPASETEAVKRAFAEPGCLEAALAYYRAISPTLPPSQRRRVEVPAVAFAGTEDIVPVAAYERARGRYLSRYEVITMPGGHFMHRQHPEEFSRHLVRVLEAERAR